jgi:ADP-heptose:LPS heptosyltransferase
MDGANPLARVERVLVLKVRALGDTLLATPALTALRRGLPGARLTAVVSPAGAEVLAGNPDVDEVRVYDKAAGGPAAHLRFARDLAAARFDLAVALHASFRTALLALASGARVRVVHNHSGRNFFTTLPIPTKKESKSTIQRDLDAVRALGLPDAGEKLTLAVTEEHRAVVRAFLAQHKLAPKGFMMLVPGAGQERKRWSASAATEFLEAAREKLGLPWIILAGPADLELACAIQAETPSRPFLFHHGLKEAAALFEASRGVVCTDSGPKHVAVAMGARTLTLWTDEPEAEWHPYDRARHALLRSGTGVVGDLPAELVLNATLAHFGKEHP